MIPGGVSMTAPSATLASFVEIVSHFTSRPVLNLTGLEDRYDLQLTFALEATPRLPPGLDTQSVSQSSAEPAPSIFDAVQQLGLRLEPRKASVEILTVTNIERTPSEN
jgi:uncharacterized protein (TIGR03435 family)